MKRILRLIVLLSIIVIAACYYNNTSLGQIISHTAWRGHINGNILKYRVSFLGVFSVGEAVFEQPQEENYSGKAVLHMKAIARNVSPFSYFFPAQIQLDSFLDRESFNPVFFKQKMQLSGKPDTDKEVFYDQEKHIMTIAGIERVIFPDTKEPLSLMFNLTNLDFSKLKNVSFNINTNQKNYILNGKVSEGKVKFWGETKPIFTLSAEIKRHDKNPYHKSYIRVVFIKEDGQRNIPILIRVIAGGALININLMNSDLK